VRERESEIEKEIEREREREREREKEKEKKRKANLMLHFGIFKRAQDGIVMLATKKWNIYCKFFQK
jgi:hypothetical protein